MEYSDLKKMYFEMPVTEHIPHLAGLLKHMRQLSTMGVKKAALRSDVPIDAIKNVERGMGRTVSAFRFTQLLYCYTPDALMSALFNLKLVVVCDGDVAKVQIDGRQVPDTLDFYTGNYATTIKWLRSEKGLTVEQLGAIAGIDAETLYKFERNEVIVPLVALVKIATGICNSLQEAIGVLSKLLLLPEVYKM